ncbi:MAG: hypothetical protein WCO98_06765 [bacterium]
MARLWRDMARLWRDYTPYFGRFDRFLSGFCPVCPVFWRDMARLWRDTFHLEY